MDDDATRPFLSLVLFCRSSVQSRISVGTPPKWKTLVTLFRDAQPFPLHTLQTSENAVGRSNLPYSLARDPLPFGQPFSPRTRSQSSVLWQLCPSFQLFRVATVKQVCKKRDPIISSTRKDRTEKKNTVTKLPADDIVGIVRIEGKNIIKGSPADLPLRSAEQEEEREGKR